MLNSNLDNFIFSRLEEKEEPVKAQESYKKFLDKIKANFDHKEVLELEELLNSCVAENEFEAYKQGLKDGLAMTSLNKEKPAATQGN